MELEILQFAKGHTAILLILGLQLQVVHLLNLGDLRIPIVHWEHIFGHHVKNLQVLCRINFPVQHSSSEGTPCLLYLLPQLFDPGLGPLLAFLEPVLQVALTGNTAALVTWLGTLVHTGMATASQLPTRPKLTHYLAKRHVALAGQLMSTGSLKVNNGVADKIRQLLMAKLGDAVVTGRKHTDHLTCTDLFIDVFVVVLFLKTLESHLVPTARHLQNDLVPACNILCF